MVYFHTKSPDLVIFWRALHRIGKCWNILWPFGTAYGSLVYFIAIWYILLSFRTFRSRFGILRIKKSGNPGSELSQICRKPATRECFDAFRAISIWRNLQKCFRFVDFGAKSSRTRWCNLIGVKCGRNAGGSVTRSLVKRIRPTSFQT
jgi:hypothetical protein